MTQIPDVGRHTAAMLRRYSPVAGVIESSRATDMQTNEFVGLVQHGLPLHLVQRLPTAEPAARETRVQEMGPDEPRRPAAWQPADTPPRYGAGF